MHTPKAGTCSHSDVPGSSVSRARRAAVIFQWEVATSAEGVGRVA